MDTGWIIGMSSGLIGGAVGTYYMVANTKCPRERAFMVQTSIVMWMIQMAVVLGAFLLPTPYNLFLLIPVGLMLTVGVRFVNGKQQDIRDTEAAA